MTNSRPRMSAAEEPRSPNREDLRVRTPSDLQPASTWLIAMVPLGIAAFVLCGTYVIVDAETSVYLMPGSGGPNKLKS